MLNLVPYAKSYFDGGFKNVSWDKMTSFSFTQLDFTIRIVRFRQFLAKLVKDTFIISCFTKKIDFYTPIHGGKILKDPLIHPLSL